MLNYPKQSKKKYYKDKRVPLRQFHEGTKVFVFNTHKSTRKGGKKEKKWLGPYIVTSVLSKGCVKLRNLKGSLIKRSYNVKLLKKCVDRKEKLRLNANNHADIDQKISNSIGGIERDANDKVTNDVEEIVDVDEKKTDDGDKEASGDDDSVMEADADAADDEVPRDDERVDDYEEEEEEEKTDDDDEEVSKDDESVKEADADVAADDVSGNGKRVEEEVLVSGSFELKNTFFPVDATWQENQISKHNVNVSLRKRHRGKIKKTFSKSLSIKSYGSQRRRQLFFQMY
ncbi:YTH domain-containing protein 1-like [Saccostrea cucullata]|uniref:YTH domain-containing protein 1-like n=1 Tax=Saccostrea cuccullata TaxID=36930 RepID=UPI002ED59E33